MKKEKIENKSKKEKTAKKVEKKIEKKTRVSRSGTYKSIRHMMETMFYKNQDFSSDEAMKIVKKEFPDSAYVNSNHFPWYHTHIVNLKEFTIIEPPKWAKGGAKIKTTKKVDKKKVNKKDEK